jgi:hypothetical protein
VVEFVLRDRNDLDAYFHGQLSRTILGGRINHKDPRFEWRSQYWAKTCDQLLAGIKGRNDHTHSNGGEISTAHVSIS